MKFKKFMNGAKHYLVDTTGLVMFSTPIYAAMETFVSGMSVSTAIKARLGITGLAYLGIGIAYAKGRDFSRKLFKINDKSNEAKQTIHDSGYNVVFNTALTIPMYLSSGATLEQALKGAGGAIVLGLISGPINGYSIDTYRDLLGTKSSERMPKFIKNSSSKVKKGIAIALTAGILALTVGVYGVKDKFFTKNIDAPVSTLEQTVSTNQGVYTNH